MAPDIRPLDYYIVGAQKSGTTALHSKICSDAQFYSAPIKETHFFDDESQDWAHPNYADLAQHFVRAPQHELIGDATPIYMYWPECLNRIYRFQPTAKLIFILRDPAARAASHWRMETARSAETLPFAQAVSPSGRARYAGQKAHRSWSYVERGVYAPQIKRAIDLFGRQQLFFCTTDELDRDEVGLLNRVFRFLGAEPTYERVGPKYVRAVDSSGVTNDLSADIASLRAHYIQDILQTEQMTGLDLSAWTA